MEEVKFNLNEHHGSFTVLADGKEVGEMVVGINGDDLTVYHTEVVPEAEGKGFAKKMLNTMVDYARKHHLHVIPLCPYVHAQFKRHPQAYENIWKKGA